MRTPRRARSRRTTRSWRTHAASSRTPSATSTCDRGRFTVLQPAFSALSSQLDGDALPFFNPASGSGDACAIDPERPRVGQEADVEVVAGRLGERARAVELRG